MTEERFHAIPEGYRPALRLAASLLLDDILHSLVDGTEVHSMAIDELPPSFRHRIEGDLFRWVVAFTVSGSKLLERPPLPPACVAEQLAMHAILDFAVGILQDAGEFGLPDRVPEATAKGWREEVLDHLYPDTDFLLLYEGLADGIGADPDEPVAAAMGMRNLAYADWFRPLGDHEVHPYHDEGDRPEPEDDDCPWF